MFKLRLVITSIKLFSNPSVLYDVFEVTELCNKTLNETLGSNILVLWRVTVCCKRSVKSYPKISHPS